MINLVKKNIFLLFLILVSLGFFYKFIINGLIPIPADTIIGLYHPYRDLYASTNPNGIAFKNSLITDPVRQTYIWKELAVNNITSGSLPLWNPYEASGKPLLANFQSGVFYPLNFILFIKPFPVLWGIFIMIQPLLAGIFMYFFLRNLKLDERASFLGAITLAFSGFSIAWLEWGNILHTFLWLPLIFLSIDKLIEFKNKKQIILWSVILLFSLCSSFFAGHLQIFIYSFLFSFVYLLYRWFKSTRKIKNLLLFAGVFTVFLVVTFIQWFPTLQFINLSARSIDLSWKADGWFMPIQNLVQIFAPDFFGNPATLNYWGVWNYAEFSSYIGIITLIFVVLAFFKRNRVDSLFFGISAIFLLLFIFPNPISKLPFELNVPFLSTAQPTRLLSVFVFCLSSLSAIGFDYFITNKKKLPIFVAVLIIAFSVGSLWLVVYSNLFNIDVNHLVVSRRNIMFPTIVFLVGTMTIILFEIIKSKHFKNFLLVVLLLIVSFDLFRSGWKFTPFTPIDYIYPETKILSYLQQQEGIFRIASDDSRILPPNVPTHYKLSSIEGYDPLYKLSYGELIAASERGEPNITYPLGFNRIITPHNISSPIIDLLNVRYVLSFNDLDKDQYNLIMNEGVTKLYENKNYYPRTFFVNEVASLKNKQTGIEKMFSSDLLKFAVIDSGEGKNNLSIGDAKITEYENNKVVIETNNNGNGFLVLTDNYYPTWEAFINGQKTEIFKTDLAFRGVFVSKGKNIVVFKNRLIQ